MTERSWFWIPPGAGLFSLHPSYPISSASLIHFPSGGATPLIFLFIKYALLSTLRQINLNKRRLSKNLLAEQIDQTFSVNPTFTETWVIGTTLSMNSSTKTKIRPSLFFDQMSTAPEFLVRLRLILSSPEFAINHLNSIQNSFPVFFTFFRG